MCGRGAGGTSGWVATSDPPGAEELIHSKQDTLHFRAFFHVLEVHDFSWPEESDDSDGDGQPPQLDSSNDGDDGYPGYNAGPMFL
jgi:hypothetical protein